MEIIQKIQKMKSISSFRVVIILFLLLFSQYTLLGAQTITLSGNNLTIKSAFVEIEKQTDMSIDYDESVINLHQKISTSIQGKSLEETMNILLKGTGCSFVVKNNHIVISVNAQDTGKSLTVTGVITDEHGEPVIGVNVIEKGTTNGCISDMDGRYSLDVQPNSILQVSYIGYISREIRVNNQKVINVQLREDTQNLEEVVVVGYGTQRRKDLTGAVSSINASEIQSRSVPSVAGSLQGKLSGVMIQETGGDLTGRFQFAVRGTGSVTGSNNPLLIVDGVPLFNDDLSTLNTKDVVSIDVLKDASASAIYGSRASNGVVIITTKRGQSGKPVVSFSMDLGFENIAKRYEVLTTDQQRLLFVEAFKNTNRNPAVYENVNDPVWQIDTDWQKEGTRTGVRQNYNLSVQGGSENNKYAVSGSFSRRLGTMKNSDLNEFFLRANNDISIGEKVKIASSISGAHQRQNKLSNDAWGSGAYQRLISSHSYLPAYDETGDFFAVSSAADPYFGENSNPLINQLMNVNKESSSRMMGSIKIDYNILKELTFTVNAGTDLGFINGYQYLPVYQYGRYTRTEGSTTNTSREMINWVTEATLQYSKKWRQHSLSALIGASAQQHVEKRTSTTGTGTIDNSLDQLSNQTNFTATGTSVTSALASTFVRLNYSFNDRYLFTGTVRRDGSSKFGPDKRYGIFPSISGAWRMSEEAFLRDVDFLTNLKLRVGYGLTGNQNIGDFAYVTRAGASPYIWGNSMVVGNSSVNMGNPKLQWESAQQFNVGIDASFLDSRLSLVLDYYDKRSRDLLIQTPVPYIAAVSENPYVNLGSVQNRGVEIGINSNNISTKKFSWTTSFNISFNKNKVLDIGTNALGEPLQIPGENISLPNDFANLTKKGHPVGAFYMYQFDGIWQKNEVDEAALFGAVPGDPKFVDRNNSKSLDTGDKDFVGSPLPTYFGGFTNTFSYGPFSLNIFFNFAGGNKIYHAMRNLNARSVPFNQQLAEIADFWTENNPSNTIPRPSQGGNTTFLATRVSTNYLEDGKYLRLKNVSLSYALPKSLLTKLNISDATVSVNGANLVTFTKYTGLDPEASSTTSLLSGGIDYTPYPSTRFYSFSLQLSF